MKKFDLFYLLSGAVGIAGFVGLACAVKATAKTKEVAEALNTTIDKLSDNVDVDAVNSEILNAAVDRAVNKRLSKDIEQATSKVLSDIKKDMNDQIRIAVKDNHSELSKEVEEKISKEVENIDIDELKKTVSKRAEDQFAKKLDSELDSITKKYKDNLDNIKKVYGSIINTSVDSLNDPVSRLLRAESCRRSSYLL